MEDDSTHSIAVDMQTLYLGGKEHIVRTGHGCVSVILYGDEEKPPLITYPDVALNHMSCFQGLFFCPEAASLLLHNFCIYHITPPGHELLQLGAASICPDVPVPSVDDLCDQILEVLNHFRLGSVMCMGAMAGAYLLTLFATRYRDRVTGLILISPLCKAPSWTEWLYNKLVSNLLYYYGMCSLSKECLIQRYFSKEVRGTLDTAESDIVQACRKLLNERQSINVLRFLQAIDRRPDITQDLEKLKCRTLIFVGDRSLFHSEALHMSEKLDRRFSALVEVQGCGSMVTEEQPQAMLVSLEYFLIGFGLYRPSQSNGSPRSTLSPFSVSPELLSPESLGLKLKPIKTRVPSRGGDSTRYSSKMGSV